jgi:glutamyl-Q tRNA(Asp) synthetase
VPTRFAPSPTGFLHLGHAYSALTAWEICQKNDKRFILRIEDIDYQRCKPEYEQSILQDLQWLGIEWEEPILKQNTRLSTYKEVIEILINKNLLYPCSCTRRGINQALLAPQNAPPTTNYPGTCRLRLMSEKNKTDNIRLNVSKAMCYIKNLNYSKLTFTDNFYKNIKHQINENSPYLQDDIIIARKDIGTSYHLSVVVDDAYQDITHVVRGDDLLHSTPIQRLLQAILELPEPMYHHHKLIKDNNDNKLAKRLLSKPLRSYINEGLTITELKNKFN